MKTTVLALVALAPLSAFAQAAPANGLTDLMYIPAAGTVYGETGVHWDSQRYHLQGTSGTYKIDKDTARQKLGYGVNDQLQLNLTYEYQGRGKYNLPSGGDDYNYRGSLNPEVGALYRLKSQGQAGHSVDVFGGFSPDLWKAEQGNRHGTAASGGPVFNAGVRAGSKDGDVEQNIIAAVKYYGAASIDNLSDNSTTKVDSYYNLDLRYNYQYHYTPDLWFRGSAHAFTNSEQSVTSAGTKTTQDMNYGYGVEASLWAALVPEVLAVNLGVNWAHVLDYDGKSGSNSLSYQNQHLGGAFFNFRYQF